MQQQKFICWQFRLTQTQIFKHSEQYILFQSFDDIVFPDIGKIYLNT